MTVGVMPSLQQGEGQEDVSHTQRWNSLEIVRGAYSPEDCVNDIAEIKFDRPVPIKVCSKTTTSSSSDGL